MILKYEAIGKWSNPFSYAPPVAANGRLWTKNQGDYRCLVAPLRNPLQTETEASPEAASPALQFGGLRVSPKKDLSLTPPRRGIARGQM